MPSPRVISSLAALAVGLVPLVAPVTASAAVSYDQRGSNIWSSTVRRGPRTAPAATSASTFTRVRAVDVMSDTPPAGWRPETGATEANRSTVEGVSTAGVTNAAPAAVYADHRWAKEFTYTLDDLVPGRTYRVRLHMVEDHWGSAGKRVIDVYANGQRVLAGLDPYAVAGAYRPVVRDVTVTAGASGSVALRLVGRVGDATLSGFEVLAPSTALRPATPSAVVAKAASSHAVNVSWKGSMEASSYAVYRDGAKIATTVEPAVIDRTAAPGRSYGYTVVAQGVGGSSAASTAVRATTPASDALVATGAFHTGAGVIVDPKGQPFVPVGANIGSWSTATGRGVAHGHAVEAKAWGWNTVRVTFYASDEFDWTYRAQWGYAAQLDLVRQTIAEYRAQGLVVIVDAHDIPELGSSTEHVLGQMEQFWKDVARANAGDSGVWFNLTNEPAVVNRDWYDRTERLLKAVRSTGAKNIALVDPPVWGQDLGSVGPWFVGAQYGYDAHMAPALAARYGNVVLSQHNYGAYDRYTSAASYGAYADRVHSTGLPLVTGETGFTIDGSSTAGGYDINRRAALAAFASNPGKKVGTLVWNGTHDDNYSLKNDGGPFYSGSWVGANLSEMGRNLWALSH